MMCFWKSKKYYTVSLSEWKCTVLVILPAKQMWKSMLFLDIFMLYLQTFSLYYKDAAFLPL